MSCSRYKESERLHILRSSSSSNKPTYNNTNISTTNNNIKMVSYTTIVSALLAFTVPFVAAAAIPEPEAHLEERQSFSAPRFYADKNYQGGFADLVLDVEGACSGSRSCLFMPFES